MTAAYFEDHPTDPDKVILRKKPHLDKGRDYEEGFIDGMQHQMQSSVDKAVNAMTQPTYYIPNKDEHTWFGLTDEEVDQLAVDAGIVTWVKRVYDDVDKKFYDLPLGEGMEGDGTSLKQFANLISTRLKEKNT